MSFDLSLARGLDYYTGIIYEAILTGTYAMLDNYMNIMHKRFLVPTLVLKVWYKVKNTCCIILYLCKISAIQMVFIAC